MLVVSNDVTVGGVEGPTALFALLQIQCLFASLRLAQLISFLWRLSLIWLKKKK